MKSIVQMGKKVLRQKAEPVLVADISSLNIQSIIARMNEVLLTQNDGVAIAAPQIGESYQIFTVAPHVLKNNNEPLVYINPKIIERSKKTKLLHEGCLSCRWKVGDVKRHTQVTIEAYDEYGEQFTEEAEGLLAHIFQHEIDHLHGILFIDKAENLRDMTQEEIDDVVNGR